MPKVTLVREDRVLEVPEGANLREALLAEGVEVYRGLDSILNCRGHGLCGTCIVEVSPREALSPTTLRERMKIWRFGARPIRLSCQAKVAADCRVLTRPQLQQGWMNHPYYGNLKESVDTGPSHA